MRKFIIIIVLLQFTSCSKIFNETPTCDNAEVKEIVSDLMKVKYANPEGMKYDIFGKIMGIDYDEYYSKYDWDMEKKSEGNELENNIDNSIYQYVFEKKEDGIPSNILTAIKEVESKYNFPQSKYDNPKIENIRIISLDDDSKICNCEAYLQYDQENIKSGDILYSAQKNTDGDINVEIEK